MEMVLIYVMNKKIKINLSTLIIIDHIMNNFSSSHHALTYDNHPPAPESEDAS